MKLNHILETSLYVKDISSAKEFYTQILGFEIAKETPDENRDLFLKCGNTILILFNPEETKIPSGIVPAHGSVGQGHIAFGIPDSDFSLWRALLTKNNVDIEKEIDWDWGSHSLYFRDTDGNSLELVSENHWTSFLNY